MPEKSAKTKFKKKNAKSRAKKHDKKPGDQKKTKIAKADKIEKKTKAFSGVTEAAKKTPSGKSPKKATGQTVSKTQTLEKSPSKVVKKPGQQNGHSEKLKTGGGRFKRRIKELKKELEYLNKRNQPFVLLKDEEGRYYCQEENCDQPTVTGNFCRYHYLSTWKYNREKNMLLSKNYLERTIKDFVQRHGESILSILLKDLKSKKNFDQAIGEMNLPAGKGEDFSEGDEL